jgi:plasmid stabilization system protein ParE
MPGATGRSSTSEIDEDLAEYQHKTGLLNIRHAVRYCLRAKDLARGEQLLRELSQQCDELTRGLGLGKPRTRRRMGEENVSARPPR